MWNRSQIKDFQNALAAAEKVRPQVEHLAELAKHSPALADRVEQLQAMLETITRLCETALTTAPKM